MLLTVLALPVWSGFEGYRTLAPLAIPATCLILLGIWWWAIRRLGRWQALLLEQQRCREAAEGQVRELDRELERRVAERTRALSDSETLLRTVIDHAPVVLHALDRQGNFILSQGRGLEALGLIPGQLVGGPVDELYWDIPELADHFRRALAGETVRAQVQVRGVIHDSVYTPVRDEQGEVTTVIMVSTDITERWQAQEKVRRLAAALEQGPLGVLIRDNRGMIDYVNPRFCELTGYQAEELLGTPRNSLPSIPCAQQQQETLAAEYPWRREFQQYRSDGGLFWAETSLSPLQDDRGFITHYLETLEDISLRKQREAQLLRQGGFDPLTGLPNRLLALERLERAVARTTREGSQVAVLIVALEGLKDVGQTLGPRAVDRLLQQAALRLVDCVDDKDTVARLRGQEFLILLSDPGEACSQQVAAGIHTAFAEAFQIEGRRLQLTPAIGLAMAPVDGQDASSLLQRADTALEAQVQKGGRMHG